MLSFFSIFGIHNNVSYNVVIDNTVVNCFHFSVSLGYTTTQVNKYEDEPQLWIAFIFQYLWDTPQHLFLALHLQIRCELLSFFSIFGIHNNKNKSLKTVRNVVNCFHFSVSLGYTTTGILLIKWFAPLWIAFIFQYLWDTQQLNEFLFVSHNCCELLSFFSIFGIHNNLIF